MNTEEAKIKILSIVDSAEKLTPNKVEPNLPDFEPGIPEWHKYEQEIWELGEKIRQLISKHEG